MSIVWSEIHEAVQLLIYYIIMFSVFGGLVDFY